MTRLPTLLCRALASVAGAALVLLLTAPAALAHDRLESSSPADKAKVEHVKTIELKFNARMTMPTIVLDGPGGTSVPLAKPRIEGAKIFAEPETELEAGKYRLAWRVLSSDGHPIQGELRFTVTPPATTPSATATPESSAGVSPAPSSPVPAAESAPSEPAAPPSSPVAAPVVEEGGVPGWLWIGVAVLVLGGAAIFVAGRRKNGPGTP